MVAKPNEFGQTRYGFIDPTGKTVIAFDFSKKPGNFYNNRAFVTPKDQTDFNYGYIDKRGNLKIKLKTSAPKFSSDFTDGFTIAEYGNNPYKTVLIDTSGNEPPLSNTGTYNGQEYRYVVNSNVVDGQILIFNGVSLGLMNPQGEIIIPPIFQNISYFDPTSKLAKATFKSGNNKVDSYLDENGFFVIIKSPAFKW